jgi:hypothetical protein
MKMLNEDYMMMALAIVLIMKNMMLMAHMPMMIALNQAKMTMMTWMIIMITTILR